MSGPEQLAHHAGHVTIADQMERTFGLARAIATMERWAADVDVRYNAPLMLLRDRAREAERVATVQRAVFHGNQGAA